MSGISQILTFSLADETYGVELLRVREIRGWSAVTQLPETPEHFLGVLQIRGAVVPVVDLRLRLGMQATPVTPLTVIIVLSIETPGERIDVGLLVDRVLDVIDIGADSVKPAPSFDGKTGSDLVNHLVVTADRMVLLLDLDKLTVPDSISSGLAAA